MLDIEATDYPLVMMHKEDAKFIGVRKLNRVHVKVGDHDIVAVVDLTEKLFLKEKSGFMSTYVKKLILHVAFTQKYHLHPLPILFILLGKNWMDIPYQKMK